MNTFLIIFFFIVALLAIKTSLLGFYHFKKFKLPDSHKASRYLKIFKAGYLFFLFLSFFFLILMVYIE